MKRYKMIYLEADRGDVPFFHGDTLHASAANTSPNSRVAHALERGRD